jgi:hypothetical protein
MLDKERKVGVLEKYAAHQEFIKMAYLQALEDADVYAFEDRKEAILDIYLLGKEAGLMDTTAKVVTGGGQAVGKGLAKARSVLTGAKPGDKWYVGGKNYEKLKSLRTPKKPLKDPATGTATASKTTGNPDVDKAITQLQTSRVTASPVDAARARARETQRQASQNINFTSTRRKYKIPTDQSRGSAIPGGVS